MKKLAAIALIALALVPAAVSAQTNVTGKWTGTFTRTAPDGQTQSLNVVFNFTHKGKTLTGTVGPNADTQWAIEKGVVNGPKITFQVQQPNNGPLRTFTLELVKGRLQGTMRAELNGQSFEAKVDAERAK